MLNQVTIMGRLTRDPELRRTANGTAVTSFTLANDRDFAGSDGKRETDFIDCVAWRNTAEFVNKYFGKGRMAVVTGRLQIRKYKDKEGNARSAAEILVDSIYFGDSKKETDETGTQQGAAAPNADAAAPAPAQTTEDGFTEITDEDDTLPF